MMLRFRSLLRGYARWAAVAATAGILAACTAAPAGLPPQPILASAPTSGLLAVSAVGSTNVRILHVRGGSIVLLRMVFLPDGERVESVTWSGDEREALIRTSGGMLALDTRTWRLEAHLRLAAASPDDAGAGGRR